MTLILYYIFLAKVWFLNLFPLRFQYLVANVIYYLLYYVFGYRKAVVLENLQNSFPEKNELELKQIQKKFYKHLADMFIEVLALKYLSKEEILQRVKFRNPEVLDDYYNKNKSVAIVIGHYGNWEWLSSVALVTKLKVIAIIKPLSNKYFNRFMNSLRHRSGMHTTSMNLIVREIVNAKRKNEPIATFFASDQSPMKQDIKYWADFLNQKTPVYIGLEKLASKHNHAIVFFKMIKVKRGYYEVEIIKLFDDVSQVSENEITSRHLKILEDIIIEAPEYWLWTHKRWKHKYTE